MNNSNLIKIFLRYLSVLAIGSHNLYLIYFIFTPITIWTFYGITHILFGASFLGNNILANGNLIEIIPACVSGTAYYLLFSLGMLTRIKSNLRFKVIVSSISIFFVFNIVRLLILTSLIKSSSFEIIHWIFWHIISTIFVIAIWIIVTRKYKIKEIPVYSDIIYLKKLKKKLQAK